MDTREEGEAAIEGHAATKGRGPAVVTGGDD
jgi:hypothetical protein